MKRLVLHSVFILICSIVFGQKPLVQLSVDPKTAEVGEVLTISVKHNMQGTVDIQFPNGFEQGYNVMNGMEQETDYNTGKQITYFYYSQTGSLNKEGTFTFGPAYVKKGNKVYRSNTVTVTIKKENTTSSGTELSSKQLRQPAFGVVLKSKDQIYEGEAVVLTAKVFARFSPSHLEDYQPYVLDGVIDKHEFGANNGITVKEERIKGNTFYTFEHDKRVLFPMGTGDLTISPFKLLLRRGFESMPLTSSGTTIKVRPLPGNAPKEFNGGVGKFTISREIQAQKIKQGDVFTMIVRIKGEGNLQNLTKPDLLLPKGFIIYGDPIISEDFDYGFAGAEGSITYEFNIQATRSGMISLPGTRMAYFDPDKEKYILIETESASLEVSKNPNFKGPTREINAEEGLNAREQIFSLRMNEGNALNSDLFFQSKGFWIALSSPLILALLTIFWIRKKETNEELQYQRTSTKESQEKLKDLFSEAGSALDQNDWNRFYLLLERGLLRSMAHYLKNDDSLILSKSEILLLLNEKNISESLISELRTLFTACENARYGMEPEGIDRLELLNRTKTTIGKITGLK